MRAFYSFAAHRSYYHTTLKKPLFKCAPVIASLADPVHGYTAREWTAYDVRYRLHMCLHHDDCIRWTQIDEQVWRESRILARDNTVAPLPMPVDQMRTPGAGSNICDQLHHQWRACPNRFSDGRSRPNLPFPGRPAQEGGPPVCHNFNEGNCASPCRYGRTHQSALCGIPTQI